MRPATRPASVGASAANAAGAAMAPMHSSTPAHSPAIRAAKRAKFTATAPGPGSPIPDRDDFVVAHAAGRLHLGHVAGRLADQRPRDRRADRDQAVFQIGLVVADDLVGHRDAAVFVFQVDRRGEHDAALGVQRPRVDDLRGRELALDLEDAAFDEALLVLRRLVLGVLRQVALRARLGDGLDDGVTLDVLQPGKLFRELLGAADREGNGGHDEQTSIAKITPPPGLAGGGTDGAEFSAVRDAVPAETTRRGRLRASSLRPPLRTRPCWC